MKAIKKMSTEIIVKTLKEILNLIKSYCYEECPFGEADMLGTAEYCDCSIARAIKLLEKLIEVLEE